MPVRKANRNAGKPRPKNKPKQGGSRPTQNSSIATIQNARRAQTKSVAQPSLPPYVHCRLNPFGGGSAMYPGGGSAPVIVLEHRSFCDIRCNNAAASSLHLRIIPSAPYMSIVHADGTTSSFIITNSKGVTTYGPAATTGGNVMTNWMPGNTAIEYDTSAYPGGATRIAPYSAVRARVTAGGFRLTYTGQTLSCQGLISMTQGSLNVVSRESLPLAADMRGPTDAVANAFSANTTDSVQVDGAVVSNPCMLTTVTVPMSAGASGTLQQIDPNLPFRPVTQQGALLIADEVADSYIGTGTGTRGAIGFYDESWSPTDIYISNIANGVQFRVEVSLCVEYQVDSTSDVARFTRKAPPAAPAVLACLQSAITKSVPYGTLDYLERSAANLGKQVLSSLKSAASARVGQLAMSAGLAALTL